MNGRGIKRKAAIREAEHAFDRELGARIREKRVGAGLKQNDVARRLETTIAKISQIELGSVRCAPAMLARISSALGCEPGDIINGLKVEIAP